MYQDKIVAVIIPMYNEENQIARVIKTIPGFVDHIVVVDDRSTDRSVDVVENLQKEYPPQKLILLKNTRNEGCGGALVRGYLWILNENIDIAVRMDADGQMDPRDLPGLLNPLVDDKADYVKGNRLSSGKAYEIMPKIRYFGNAILSLLTKIASGYWHITDSQCGFSAINRRAIETINWNRMYKRYGQPSDLLILLNIYNFRVHDVPVMPVYNVGQKSHIKIHEVIPRISCMLVKGFFRRMRDKYIIRDFHPLVLFYALGILTFLSGFGYGLYLFFFKISHGPVAETSAIFAAFLAISSLQLLFWAMLFDMDYNETFT